MPWRIYSTSVLRPTLSRQSAMTGARDQVPMATPEVARTPPSGSLLVAAMLEQLQSAKCTCRSFH